MLKKLAKIQEAKDKKAAKKAGGNAQPEEKKGGDQKAGDQKGADQKGGEEKPKKQKQQQPPPKAKAVVDNSPDLSKMDIRVGKIVGVVKNPNSEKLYNEEIDIGNGEIRLIASGLQKFIPIEKVQDAMVVVLCNLKAKKLADYMSHGMVLCAQPADGSVVEFLTPPEGSVPGDLVSFEGFERKPVEQLNAKKNPWDNVRPKLNTDDSLVGCYKNDDGKNIPFMTPKGVCKASTVKGGLI